jgi:hypothetical protein
MKYEELMGPDFELASYYSFAKSLLVAMGLVGEGKIFKSNDLLRKKLYVHSSRTSRNPS